MKICFLATTAYCFFKTHLKQTHGGSELQLGLIAKELAKDNYNISFIVGDFGQKNTEIIDKIKFYKNIIPKETDGKFKKIFQAIKYWKLLKKINADIYFTSAANSIVGLVSLFCKLNKKKHIHRTAHDIDVDGTWIKTHGILGKVYKYGLINANVLLTQHEKHKQLLFKTYKKQAIVFYNFPISKLSYNKNVNKKYILWVGRCHKMKNPKIFLELARHVPNKKFVMIAPKAINIQYWQEIKNQCKKINNLEFIDYVAYNKIQKYFYAAKIFINTSDYEGYPNTFIQAGFGKTPIISLNVNPNNFITKYNCGYFCEGNFIKMKEKLLLLLKNKSKWQEKSQNIYKYMKKKHDKNQNIKKLKKIIDVL